jgi:hypothetical protein
MVAIRINASANPRGADASGLTMIYPAGKLLP